MISYDFASKNRANVTKTGTSARPPEVASATSFFVPAYGKQGLILMFGGLYDRGHARPFSNITIYDPASENYHWQLATGDVPKPTEERCITPVTNDDGVITDMYVFHSRLAQAPSDLFPRQFCDFRNSIGTICPWRRRTLFL